LSDLFPKLLNVDRFNVRRHQLIAVMEQIRRVLWDHKLDVTNPYRIADSASITLMTYIRGNRSQSVIG